MNFGLHYKGIDNPFVLNIFKNVLAPSVYDVFICNTETGEKWDLIINGINWTNLNKKFEKVELNLTGN